MADTSGPVSFDSLVDDSQAAGAQPAAAPIQGGQPSQGGAMPSFDDLQDDSQKYEGTGQAIQAGLEGAAQGVLGPIAPWLEKNAGHVLEEDIQGRAEAHPIAHGVGEATGLIGSTLTGVGEGAVLEHAGQAVSGLTDLGGAANLAREAALAKGASATQAAAEAAKVFKAGSWGARVGTEALKQATEMALLQGSDEVAKQVISDPEASASSALANIGLSAALGAGTGAFVTGAISPLWSATAGKGLDKALTAAKAYLDGSGKLAPPAALQQALDELGITLTPEMRSAMSGDPEALRNMQELIRSQHPEVMEQMKALPVQVRDAVTQALGVPLEDAAVFSNADSGNAVKELAKDEITQQAAPAIAAIEERNKNAFHIPVPDEDRLGFIGRLMDNGIKKVGTDSPAYKEYENYGQRILARDTVGQLDQLSTEIGQRARGESDGHIRGALWDIKNALEDFKEGQIDAQAQKAGEGMVDTDILNQAEKAQEMRGVGSEGVRVANESKAAADQALNAAREEGRQIGQGIIEQRQQANQGYAMWRQKLDKLADLLGIKNYSGTESFKNALENLTPEQVIKKFSVKNDVELQKFLQENFPNVVEAVRQHEAKQFLKGAIDKVSGEYVLDTKTLNRKLAATLKGNPELADFVLNPQARKAIENADMVHDAISRITNFKDSGTPGGMAKKLWPMLGSGIGAIGFMLGHNPVSSAILGYIAEYLGKNAPEATKLAMLRFMGSEQPVNAEGFKTMVDFLHNTYKGENMLAKGAAAVFKRGAQVTATNLAPFKDREKLDKIVDAYQKNPNLAMGLTNSPTGHYMPDHAQYLTATSVNAVRYLDQLKPRPYQSSPLDRPLPPSPAQEARYSRALDIANHPISVLQHIKDGTLQATDMQDLKAMYPKLYENMANKLTNELAQYKSEDGLIPYHTRVSLALFLGQPIDSSMTPQAILAAQPKPNNPPPSQQGTKSKHGSPAKLGKNTHLYQTPDQAAQADRAQRS